MSGLSGDSVVSVHLGLLCTLVFGVSVILPPFGFRWVRVYPVSRCVGYVGFRVAKVLYGLVLLTVFRFSIVHGLPSLVLFQVSRSLGFRVV